VVKKNKMGSKAIVLSFFWALGFKHKIGRYSFENRKAYKEE